MWKLTIEDDEGQRTTLDLALDEYTLGRAEQCSIRLTERNVSRSHALLKRANGGWTIEDLQSYNGLFVNGERVAEAVGFRIGDTVQLADYRIELADEATATATPTETDEVTPPKQRMPDRLVMVIGPVPGVEYSLVGDLVTIGRSEECNISINHASVSRVHAEMRAFGDGRWEIVDKGSANGIRINGIELRQGIIEPGDALELGDVRLRFVAAGKFFRPTADLSRQLAGVPAFDATMTPVAAQAQRRNLWRVVAVSAGVLVLAVGAFVIVGLSGSHGQQAGSGTEAAQVDEESQRRLKDAVQAAEEGDLDFAHKTLQRIPEESPARKAPEFQQIEDKWADAQFAKVEAEPDQKRKIAILEAVVEAETVDTERREKAADMIEGLGGTVAVRPKGPKQPEGKPRPKATGAAAERPTEPAPPPEAKPEAKPAAPPQPTKTTPDEFDEISQRRNLENKVWSGRGSEAEIKMLRAICSHQGDRACRDRASAMLKQKQQESQP
ncbi:MAG: FHA domain-containing protein [Deltaproteobacteria bacterium]|nr:FHA domain-containing protein [Deltaproteobacteria bacterium]